MSKSEPTSPDFSIPDHELLRCIGSGAYGKVWLAKNIMGTYRAIKVIERKNFPNPKPFDREFLGIRKFEPISRTHAGFVPVLHIGRHSAGDYFYYVMEVADDLKTGQNIHPEAYVAKTLSSYLSEVKVVPFDETIGIGLLLSSALEYLHRHALVHRDIKPSNIIFVNGSPKFADIGLVANIGESITFVGTEGYVPPEGPGRPLADIFALGKLLYQISTGKNIDDFPELPPSVSLGTAEEGRRKQFFQTIFKACELNQARRLQSSQAFHDEMAALFQKTSPAHSTTPEEFARSNSKIAILGRDSLVKADSFLAPLLQQLRERACAISLDRDLPSGLEGARHVEKMIGDADAAVVFLTAASMESEMLSYELDLVKTSVEQTGKPRLAVVRNQYSGELNQEFKSLIGSAPQYLWNSAEDTQSVIDDLVRGKEAPRAPAKDVHRAPSESVHGPVPLNSKFYLRRGTDDLFHEAIARAESIALIKGARQMGKTSLLARGLQEARQLGMRVILTDFQKFSGSNLASLEKFYLALGTALAEQLEMETLPEDRWDTRRSPNTNFERFLSRELLAKLNCHLLWALDGVDRLFARDFSSEVFGLIRSWHNLRALEPEAPWNRLTMAISYATEAHLFITDLNQSPFNVGIRVALEDFTIEEVRELNGRYSSPLASELEISEFVNLVGGQPFLVRAGLQKLAARDVTIHQFASLATQESGIFGDHLRRMLVPLAKDQELADAVRALLQGVPCASPNVFYRLRAAGIMSGSSSENSQLRCRLYSTYLKQSLCS